MAQMMRKQKYLFFLILISLIILSNSLVYTLEFMKPLPNGAVIGSLVDFLIVIPLLTYFFIIRRKYKLKYLGIVVLAGYGIAYIVIPQTYLSSFTYIPYLIGVAEGVFILFELYILYKIARFLPNITKEFQRLKISNSYFQYNVQKSTAKHLPKNKVISILISEFMVFYYSLFCWRKQVHVSDGSAFSYHRKTSVIAVYVMLIHATILESIGLHYFLHQWNEMVSYILLFLNIYAILFFLAEIHAIRLSPFLLKSDSLYLQIGVRSSIEIPLNLIKEIKYYNGPEKISRHELKTVFDARVIDFFQEKPTFEIVLKEKVNQKLLYGFTRNVDRIFLNVDESEEFYRALKTNINQNKQGL